MKPYKTLSIFGILIFVAYQIFLIATQFSDSRTIEVRREIFESTDRQYLKGYKIENIPFEEFDVQVKPKSLLDYLLLTDSDGNLLGMLIEIAFAFYLVWYIYRLEFDVIFSATTLKLLRWAFGIAIVVWITRSRGIIYTRDFWRHDFIKKGETDFMKYDFCIETAYDKISCLIVFTALYAMNTFYTYFYKTRLDPKGQIHE